VPHTEVEALFEQTAPLTAFAVFLKTSPPTPAASLPGVYRWSWS